MFNWRQQEVPRVADSVGGRVTDSTAQTCASLNRAVEKALRKEKPEILDLGPICGDTIVQLARRGARLTVEEFNLPKAAPIPKGEEPPPPPPIRIDQPDGKFDLVLVWEQADFVPPDRLQEFAKEICRVTAVDGTILLFSVSTGARKADRRGRYRLMEQDKIVREAADEAPRARWVHPTRMIEEALRGFSIQGIHLQRDQTREFLAVKKCALGKRPRKGSGRAKRKPPRKAVKSTVKDGGSRRSGGFRPSA